MVIKLMHLNAYHSLDLFSRQEMDDEFTYFPQKMGFDISCKFSHTCNTFYQ